MRTEPHDWPVSLRWQRRRLVAVLVLGLFLALGPVWGLVYTLWTVLVAVAEAGRAVSLYEVKRLSLSLWPTFIGLSVAPIGIALCAWCIMRLSSLRKKAFELENQET